MKNVFFLVFIVTNATFIFGQELIQDPKNKKMLRAFPLKSTINIDGKLSEDEWKNAEIASDFITYQPDNGTPVSFEKRTEVKVLYDDDGIYIGALLYDDPSKIVKEITERDKFGTSDFFGIFINGYNDGQQDFRFFVSTAGTQMDCMATENGEDYTWDGIWHSNVSLTDFGWIVEMKIPYAALRFSEKKEQIWGVNFFREIRRDRQKYTWNRIDNNIGAIIPQAGILEGIQDIKPPTRLFLIPYSSYYVNHNDNGTNTEFKAGMDIKYGINDSFTLDAILVPDFGQTAFDNVVLNLGPFEQQFNENRPFFTEGTDMFSKGDLLYSRRIGGSPSTYPETTDNEEVSQYPSRINLLNALKISGRTAKGLGIGVMNAITEKTEATIRNTQTGEVRSEVVEPLANYNILVLDQRFRKNSSVSLVNTSVIRDGSFRDANVTALLFDLNTKANTFNLSGNFKFSHVNDLDGNKNGYTAYLNFGKTSGKYRLSANTTYISDKYDINDLGIIFVTNYHSFSLTNSYRILKPNKTFNTFKVSTIAYSEIENSTGKPQEASFEFNLESTDKKNHYFGLGFLLSPLETFDFYQPRKTGRYVYNPRYSFSWIDISTNYNYPFALDANFFLDFYDQDKRHNYGIRISPRYRFSDQFTLVYAIDWNRQNDEKGWVDFDNDNIIFANRNRNTIENTLTGKFSINSKMTINLKARYYWSYAENLNFLTLTDDGYFLPNPNYNEDQNSNFKIWNFDLSYSWWFAPGSQVSILYRNNAIHNEKRLNKNIIDNLDHTLSNNLNNTLSISFRYYIDYNNAKKWFKT
ncbi:DUF5916 domain-containing protein [Flavobacterium cerinum]|uniref:Carbohydrate binding family 9 domain-containing protein n=1 Tax=Flavobacterium cerinum TaxID=2502784 RepID=A0ABY5ITY1_9FLAO|nr:DUF5916 domain-containing protein [Flavobacterium cerinum]UUC45806.1 carbohydrate binding family 9 domain-containing protein [Flavobacterium cerinum]